MSIVTVVAKQGDVAVCCDTQLSFGTLVTNPDNQQATKILRWGKNIIGRTGWEKYHTALQAYLLNQETRLLASELEVSDFFHEFWASCKDRFGLISYQPGNVASPWLNADSEFLVVNLKGIFVISGDLSVTRFQRFHAIGSGKDLALGAMHVLYPGELKAATIARRAVTTAMTYDAQCGGKIKALKLS